MGFRKHGFRQNKGFLNYLHLSFLVNSARIILVEKPGNTLCFDSEVDRRSPMEYSVYKKNALFINHII